MRTFIPLTLPPTCRICSALAANWPEALPRTASCVSGALKLARQSARVLCALTLLPRPLIDHRPPIAPPTCAEPRTKPLTPMPARRRSPSASRVTLRLARLLPSRRAPAAMSPRTRLLTAPKVAAPSRLAIAAFRLPSGLVAVMPERTTRPSPALPVSSTRVLALLPVIVSR
ncbi:MAG: hypothetical protein V5B60_13125 [Accumulibacter sp.]|uniref:hypothetical protein n=1 Tax=Accumulibacter sp. TaxID=2053492 RepID=UPI002FC352EA